MSLGFGNGDPVFILNSGGTFVSSTTWMGTDSAGCKKNDTKHYFMQMHDGVTLYFTLILS